MSLKQVLAPAMQLAAGYPIDAQTANQWNLKEIKEVKQWPYSKAVFLPTSRRKKGSTGSRRNICTKRSVGNVNKNGRSRTECT